MPALKRPLPPLARAALASSAGVVLALRAPPLGSAWLLPLVLAAAGVAILLRGRSSSAALVAFAAIGFALGHGAASATRTDCRASLPDGAKLIVRGAFEAAAAPGVTTAFRLEALHPVGAAVERASRGPAMGSAGCRGTVRARLPARASDGQAPGPVAAGTEVVGWGEWWAEPLEGSWPRPGARAGRLVFDSVRAAAPGPTVRQPLLAVRDGARARMRALFGRHGDRAAVAEALLLAQRDGLEPEVRDRFARAGLTHLLAISGLHVGLVAGTLLLLGRLLRLSPAPATLAAAGATIAYVLFLGAPNAAARAALQLVLVLGARLAQRPADPFALIAAAALILIARDPLAVLDAGFQLSFAGTTGILLLRARFLAALPGRHARFVRDAVATSAAATLATAPIAALHFGQVAPIGIVANLAAIPLVAAAVPALALALAGSFIAMPVGRFLAGAADLLLAALDAVARIAAAVPGGHAYVPRDAIAGWVAAAALAAIVAGLLARPATSAVAPSIVGGAPRAGGRLGAGRQPGAPGRPFRPAGGVRPRLRRITAAGAALALLIAWPAAIRGLGDGALEIHAIDVGQGDAFAIRSPAGRWLLVDAGPRSDRWDAGRARVVPFLLRHGVRRLDALILTHPDADHIGGAEAVLEAFEVGAIIDPGIPAGKPLYLSVLREARHEGGPWLAGRAGREVRFDDVVLTFLHPEGDALDARAAANEFSLAFALDYGRFRALFLGDVSTAVERELVARHGASLRAEVLKVAHHGSATSTSEELLAAAAPSIALVSVGRRNRYGHPAPAVLDRLARRGVRVYRTDRHGAITVRIRGGGEPEVETTR